MLKSDERQCKYCKKVKPLHEFYKNSAYFDGKNGGREPFCKACRKARKQNRDEISQNTIECSTKRCTNCGKTKDKESGFYRNKKTRDGYQSWCKYCCSHSSKMGEKRKTKSHQLEFGSYLGQKKSKKVTGNPTSVLNSIRDPFAGEVRHISREQYLFQREVDYDAIQKTDGTASTSEGTTDFRTKDVDESLQSGDSEE